MFESRLLVPIPTPDGSSIEELVNAFVATLDPKDVLETTMHSWASTKYGIVKTYTAGVVYQA